MTYNNDVYITQETTPDANTYGNYFSTQEPLDVEDDSKNLVGSKISLGINTQTFQMSNQGYQNNQYNQVIQGNLKKQGVHSLQGFQGNNQICSNSVIEVKKVPTNIYPNQSNSQVTNLTATSTNQTINNITTILSQADELSQEINEDSNKQTNQTSFSNNQSITINTINNQNVNPPVSFLNRYNSKMNEFKSKIISAFDAMLVEKQNLIENQKKAFCIHADKIDFIFLLQYEKIKSDNLKLEECFN